MSVSTILFLIAALLTSGCASTMRVHESEAGGIPQALRGIPFYTKRTAYNQTTTYERSWYAVTLTVSTANRYTSKEGEPKTTAPTVTAATREVSRDRLQAILGLQALVMKANATDGWDLRTVFDAFEDLPAVDVKTEDSTLVANTMEAVTVVDYSRELYLNAPLPWFGNSNLTTTLAPDGTLTEAGATIDTGTNALLSALPSLLPISEVVTELLLPTPAADAGAAPPVYLPPDAHPNTLERVVTVSVGVAPRGYLEVYTKTHDTNPVFKPDGSCPEDGCTLPRLTGTMPGVAFTRRPLPPATGSATTASAESSAKPGAIEFSGEIAIPQPKK